MKIITEDAAYVQKGDMAYLNQTDLPIPASVYMKFFGRGIVIVNDKNRFEFIKFDDPFDIEYFKGLDWMVDYYDVKDLSEEDIYEVADGINEERKRIAAVFNPMSPEDKSRNMDMYQRSELLNYKFYSLRDFLWFKQGHLKFDLPEGIEYPSGFGGHKVIDTVGEAIDSEESERVVEERVLPIETGIKKFLKSIFGKNK